MHDENRRGLKAFFKDRTWKFWMVAGYVAVAAVFGIFWAWSLFGPLDGELEGSQESNLRAVAQAGAYSLSQGTGNPQEIADSIVEGTDLRATVIAADGSVIADTDSDAQSLENHLDRPEVQEALAGSIGTDTRMSASEGTSQIYVAALASYNGTSAVFRVSEPLSSIQQVTRQIRYTGFALLALGILLAALIAWRAYASAAHPVKHLEMVRTDFVANASHELKTPVAGIRLLADSIETASGDGDLEATKMFATRLDSEAARLQHLVTDLLDLSRLENTSGKATEKTDVHAAVSTSFEAHRAGAAAKGLAFSFDDGVGPNDSCDAKMDAADASLIIDNLLDNAIRYTEKGSVKVGIRTSDGIIELSVSDTGIGIPQADQSRIFERFYRVDTARSRESGGTGLGLSLVRHAVARGGGQISVESQPGAGSTFTVRIPLA